MIYHWCSRADWETTRHEYRSSTFEDDGFIHFSFRHQVERTATALEAGRRDLVLLCVDEAGLPVKVEDCCGSGEGFPHVYGPIPIASVVAVLPFPPLADGKFRFPEGTPG